MIKSNLYKIYSEPIWTEKFKGMILQVYIADGGTVIKHDETCSNELIGIVYLPELHPLFGIPSYIVSSREKDNTLLPSREHPCLVDDLLEWDDKTFWGLGFIMSSDLMKIDIQDAINECHIWADDLSKVKKFVYTIPNHIGKKPDKIIYKNTTYIPEGASK